MLKESQNRMFQEVGPGTPMGNLMRHYWHPVAAVAELDGNPTKPIRLMGENLVLYKDLSGGYGLVDRHCPHRRADMSYGFVEKCGLRCNYHGWLFDEKGACIEQPFEEMIDPDGNFKGKVNIKAYPVEAKAGMLWAYMGSEPTPLIPNWEPFTWKNGFSQVVFSHIPCNWFQCQENSIDPVHFEWMHANWSTRLGNAEGPYAPTHQKIKFEEFEHGFIYKRVREDTDEENPLWTVGRVCLWPNALFTGGHFEWRVPVDDENTLSVSWFFSRVPHDREPFVQERIPYWTSPIKDPETGRWISSHIINQDIIAWVGQGVQADRTQEHLGRSDEGIIMIRKRYVDDMKRIDNGEEPKGIYRDKKANGCIDLPIIGKEQFINGHTREEIDNFPRDYNPSTPNRFLFHAGQPEEVRKQYEAATGVKMMDKGIVE
ncbi:MAG: phthalate 4,5-dioxygenase [Rhodospirillaceae bacterium]|nr:phthalate 4,5-dioxygenase [Rhodospirillaceae bacterium]